MSEAERNEPSPSWGLIGIYTLVVACVLWIVMTPWVESIAQASLRRFSLTSRSFGVWAIQQPIPAMYNFANTYEVRQWPADVSQAFALDPLFGDSGDAGKLRSGYINHFPPRIYTFGWDRAETCYQNQRRWVVTVSSYQDQRVEVMTELKPQAAGRFIVTRQEIDPR